MAQPMKRKLAHNGGYSPTDVVRAQYMCRGRVPFRPTSTVDTAASAARVAPTVEAARQFGSPGAGEAADRSFGGGVNAQCLRSLYGFTAPMGGVGTGDQ
jgi:hypothetical protein